MAANTVDPLYINPLTTQSPYFNDYDASKGYYQILGKPGYALQAREVSQIQTIVQDQIARFGSSIYQNGSIVTGGVVVFQNGPGIIHLNLASQYANTDIVANTFINKVIVSTNTTSSNVVARGYVLATDELNSNGEPPTLVIKKLNGTPFYPNDTIQIINSSIFANVASGNSVGNASVASIDTGIFYINGYFVHVDRQTIFLDKYDNDPTYLVGLTFNDGIVNSTQDTSLLDPAQGSSNFQAPGADRYQILLDLTKLIPGANTQNFIQLMSISSGNVQSVVSGPGYSVLGDTLAKQLYDTNGNFVVKPFLGSLQENVTVQLSGTVSVLPTGISFTGVGTDFLDQVSIGSTIYVNNQSGVVNSISSNVALTTSTPFMNGATNQVAYVVNPNQFGFTLSPGEGFVAGYEFETISPTQIPVNRARAFANTTSYELSSPIGNDLYVTNLYGVPNVNAMEQFDLHIVPRTNINVNSSTAYAQTVIGNAKVRAIEYQSGPFGNTAGQVFTCYLFNVNITNSSYSLAQVNSLAIFNGTNNVAKAMDIALTSKDTGTYAGNTFLNDTAYNSLIFPFPQTTIVPSSIDNINYQFQQLSTGVVFTSGVGVVTTASPFAFVGTGVLSDAQVSQNWLVTITDNRGTAIGANGSILGLYSANGRSVTISPVTTATLQANSSSTFVANVLYSLEISGTAPGPRVKTLVTANSSNIATTGGTTLNVNTTVYTANGQVIVNANGVQKTSTTGQDLYIADVTSLVKVYDFNGLNVTQANLSSATDITSRYNLDTGQRDNYYGHAQITLKSGSTPPTGPLCIFVNYYSHSGTSGYLTVDSYPNVGTNAGYASIPVYVSPTTGKTYYLRDCVDWRPKRPNGSNNYSTFLDSDTGSNAIIIEPGQTFDCGFSYYLSRIDKVVLRKDQTFDVIQGIPSLYPQPPIEEATDMLLYTLSIPPYTFSANTVNLIYNENRRYTMTDIGKLDQRITNLEYYAALNLLEQSATNLSIVDSNGLNAFKNGILVDNFSGAQVADVAAYDYAASMDVVNLELHAMFLSNNATFTINAGGSSNYALNNGEITLPYTLVTYVEQPYCSQITSVNPFNFVSFVGNLMLIPDTDTWYDTQKTPAVLVNLDGSNDAWSMLANTLIPNGPTNGFGTQYGDWQTIWSGVTATDTTTATSQSVQGSQIVQSSQATTTQTFTTQQQRSYTTTSLSTQTIQQQIGNFIVNESVEPYIRNQDVIVHANGMQPLTTVYPFFDGQPMQAFWINPWVLQIALPTTGAFFSNAHETITSSSGGTATLLSQPWYDSITTGKIYPYMTISAITGTFNIGDTITGSVSGAQATIQSVLALSDRIPTQLANTQQLQLANSASMANNITAAALIGHTVNVVANSGGYIAGVSGQVQVITNFFASNNVITVTPGWTSAPPAGARYSISSPRTSPHGVLSGEISIPSNSNLKFPSGEKKVLVTSDPTGLTTDALTYATATYYAQGLLETTQDTSVSVRVPSVATTTGVQNQTLTNQVVTEGPVVNTVIGTVQQTPPTPPSPSNPTPPCFAKGTFVMVEHNDTYVLEDLIHTLKVGDKIMSWNEETGQIEEDVIEEVLYHDSNFGKEDWAFVNVALSNGHTLSMTRNHPFILKDGSRKKLRDMQVGEKVVDYTGKEVEITNISEPLKYQPTYNFKIKKNHNYFANRILVSNGCGCGGHGGKS